jgi:hypothetical protein
MEMNVRRRRRRRRRQRREECHVIPFPTKISSILTKKQTLIFIAELRRKKEYKQTNNI